MKHNTKNEVLYLSKKKETFSEAYVSIREKEDRILTDEEVQDLPVINKNNLHYKEWQLRQKSTQRILHYLKEKNKPLVILDIGCGNGWFTNHLASIKNTTVDGLDVNPEELEQAARIFKKSHLNFMYADFFETPTFFENKYDIIILNASFQYFENAKNTLVVLKTFLKSNGEIHILDSPFYEPLEINAAKKRTKEYYKSMGALKMSAYYFHHTINDIQDFDILYQPSKGVFQKIWKRKDSPFMWLRYKKKKG